MSFKLSGMGYQSPKIAQKRLSCCRRHQLKFSKPKLSIHQVSTKISQRRSRLELPPALQGIHIEHLAKLGIAISTLKTAINLQT